MTTPSRAYERGQDPDRPPSPRYGWTEELPVEPGLYLCANPVLQPLRPYRMYVVEADGTNLAGLDAGLWAVVQSGGLKRVERLGARLWFGPIPVEVESS